MTSPFKYQQQNLWAEQLPILEIVKTSGTPCYVYSYQAIIDQWLAFDNALQTRPHQICYSVKANSNLAVLQALAQCGSGFDIVSQGELARVIAAGGQSETVVFSGVGKQAEEIAYALKANIFCFNVESEHELELIHQIAKHHNVQAPIALRVNPDVDPKSHPYISTGLKESKFGVDIDFARALYQKASKLSHLSIQGIACHIGSQLTSLSPFIDAFKRLHVLIQQLKADGILLQHIDVGGGLGICYQNETPPTPQHYAQALLECTDPALKLLIEPGRAIVANAGILLTKVLSIKQSGGKLFCIVGCAMNDLMRPTLYSAWQDIVPVTLCDAPTRLYDVVGPICESGDFIGKDRHLAVNIGDYLAIKSAGAYGFVMSSNYNSRPRSAEVMVKDNAFKIVRPRETIEELFAKEQLW